MTASSSPAVATDELQFSTLPILNRQNDKQRSACNTFNDHQDIAEWLQRVRLNIKPLEKKKTKSSETPNQQGLRDVCKYALAVHDALFEKPRGGTWPRYFDDAQAPDGESRQWLFWHPEEMKPDLIPEECMLMLCLYMLRELAGAALEEMDVSDEEDQRLAKRAKRALLIDWMM